MTMRIVAKLYPVTDADIAQAKDALEQIKRDVLAPRGAYVDGLVIVEGEETMASGALGVPVPIGPQKVVKFEGHIHFNK